MKPIRGIEIETTITCNWRCGFCPVSKDLKKPASMSMEVFNHCLARAQEYGGIVTVSINSYNEPTIDPLFMERCKAIKLAGFHLLLHTNGSGLTNEKLAELKALGNVQEITFNIPSLDKVAFEAVTKYKKLDHICAIVDEAKRLGFNVTARVNGTDEEVLANHKVVEARWPGIVPHLIKSSDRVGILDNKYNLGTNITDARLTGCELPNGWLYVSVHAETFLCCEDYYQKTVYGSLLTHSIDELRASPAFIKLYNQVNGLEDADKNLICRKCIYMCWQKPKALFTKDRHNKGI